MTTFNGTSGNDTLSGSSDADTLIGGLGDDLYLINHISDVAIETDTSDENHDTIRTSVLTSLSIYTIENLSGIENLEYIGIAPSILKGNSKANIISANSSADSNDSIYGGDGDDSLYSFGGNDYLMGGNGNDTLDGGTGADIMIGGSGDDTYFIDNIGDIAIELSTASTSYLETPGFDIAFSNGALKDMRNGWALNIEGLVYTGTTSIRIDGNSSDNYLASQSTTPDTIFGYDGNDTLDGGSGPDLLTGGTGDDVYFVDSNDTINENTNEGTDTFIGTITDISIAAFSNSIENLIYTGINSTPLKGNNLNNAIIGGNGSDTISGFEGNDTLIGGIGADSLIGGNGNDYLYGGGSPAIPDIHNHDLNKISEFNIDHVSDTLIGGTGNDNYLIDDEQDIILEVSGSANGFDAIESLIDNSLNQSKYANVEALVLYNPEPNDITVDANMPWYGEGSSAANVIVGNDRENFLSGGAGNDTLCGDLDGQVIFYDDPNELSPVTDILDGGENDDILLALFNYSPSQAGRPVNNVLLGGSGNDVYVLASNQTICYDSAGTDSALFLISGSIESFDGMENILLWGNAPTLQNAATIALNNIALATNTSGLSFNTESIYAPQALNATGNYLNNLVWGNSLDNFLSGLDGNDSIVGNNGNDTLVGGNGIDTLVGGNGDDTYVVDTGDIIVEATNGGVDVIRSATLTNYGAFANIEGIEYTGTANVLLKGATNNTINEKLIGNTGNDTILGYGGNDSIAGNDGNDSLDGGNSNDTILGGTGKDTIFGGDGNDLLYGNNVLNGLFDPASGMTDDASAILGGNGNDTIYGGNSADGLNGGEGNDWIYGFAGNDTIVGGNGTNNLSGGDGNDSITGGTGTDYIYGGSGSDTLIGGEGYNSINGEEGNDVIFTTGTGLYNGDDGNDQLTVSGNGNPYFVSTQLYGGAGNDTLTADAAGGIIMVGDLLIDSSDSPADVFRISARAGANSWFDLGVEIQDFGENDRILFQGIMTGNGDAVLNNPLTKTTSGGTFASNAELVIVTPDIYSILNSTDLFNVLGQPSSAFSVNDKRLFIFDDGSTSFMFQFTSLNNDSIVSGDELHLIGKVRDVTNMNATTDFGLY